MPLATRTSVPRLTRLNGGAVRAGPCVCRTGLDSRSKFLRPVLLALAHKLFARSRFKISFEMGSSFVFEACVALASRLPLKNADSFELQTQCRPIIEV